MKGLQAKSVWAGPRLLMHQLRRLAVGPPLRTSAERRERLGKPAALAVLSADALSSVAYATEAMVQVLIPAVGLAAFSVVLPISLVIIGLLVILVFSYRQTIKAYPSIAGAYIVTRDNFGPSVAPWAGAGLLLDYVMTAAISTSAGVAAIYSAFPSVFPFRVVASVALLWLIAWVNLRGLKVTGRVFSVPTFLFITSMVLLVLVGIVRYLAGGLHPLPPPRGIPNAAGAIGLFLILHAYASGTTALTGVEAISDGVPIFRPVEWRNARTVLTWMGTILAVLFGGISFLASRLNAVPTEKQTLLSELARAAFGSGTIGDGGYLFAQVSTTMILVFAAQTSFADFPRLSNFAARDGYMPMSFYRRGDRLVFSTGILVLTVFATIITVVLRASVESLIPLFAIGAFSAFTFSQAGMTARHLRLREAGWRRSLAINGFGAILSGAALLVILIAKFSRGAWVALILVPLGALALTRVHRHYVHVERRLDRARTAVRHESELEVLVLVSTLDKTVERACRYVELLGSVGGVHGVCIQRPDPALRAAFEARYGWELLFPRNTRGKAAQIRTIVRRFRRGHAERLILVVVPERVTPLRRWSRLGAARAARFRRAISRERGTALAIVPTMPEDDSLLASRPRRHAGIVSVDSADVVGEQAVIAGQLATETLTVVHVDVDAKRTKSLRESWAEKEPAVRLQIEPAPFRDPTEPLLSLVGRARRGDAFITVVFGKIAPRWWQRPLHIDEFKEAWSVLLREPGTALIVVPFAL